MRTTTAPARSTRITPATSYQHTGAQQHHAENCANAQRTKGLNDTSQTAFPVPAMVAAAYFLVAAVALAFVVRSVRTYYSLKEFGGHWSSGWSRLWLLNTQSSGEMHKRFAALNRKHGEFSTRAGFFLVTTALESRSYLPNHPNPRPAFLRKSSHEGVWSRDTRAPPGNINATSHIGVCLSQIDVPFVIAGSLRGKFRIQTT